MLYLSCIKPDTTAHAEGLHYALVLTSSQHSNVVDVRLEKYSTSAWTDVGG